MAKSKGRFLAELLGSDGKVEKAKSDAAIYAGANVTIAADGTLTTTTLPLAGGALTGSVTTNSTFDGVDIATRDAILTSTTTTAGAALPKAGGTMTGALDMGSNNITTTGKVLFANVYSGTGDLPSASTYHGMFAHVHGTGKGYFAHAGSWVELANQSSLTTATTTAGAALPKAGGAMTGAITTNSTFDGVDIATRDAVLTSTTTTANAALPKAGGTMTGAINAGANNISNINNTSSISFLSTNGYWTAGTQRMNGSGDLVNIGTIGSGAITSTGAVTGTYFSDGYVTWNAAQFNRSGAAIEFQFTPTNANWKVKIGANGDNPTEFNAYTGDADFSGEVSTPSAKLKAIAESNTDTAVDVFVYDTRKDSDGGAWRKRTQHTSWYNETLNTSTRGARKEFPSVAVIVAEAYQLTIYDGDDPDMPMWMVFNGQAAGGYLGYGIGAGRSLSSVVALNGAIHNGGLVGNWATDINFITERGYFWGEGNSGYTHTAIVNRNTASSITEVSSSIELVHGIINDIAVTALPNAPIDADTGLPVPTIAVATNGGVSIIKDDGTVHSLTGGAIETISINDRQEFITTPTNSSDTMLIKTLNTTDANLNWNTGLRGYSWNPATGLYPFLSFRQANTVATPEGFNFSRNAGVGGMTLMSEDFTNARKTLQATISSDFNTGWMNGDIKLATLSDTDTTNAVGTELVTNGTFASNITGWTLREGNGTFSASSGVATLTYVSSSTSWVTSLSSITAGKTYTLSFDLVSASTASVQFYYNHGSGSDLSVSMSGSTAGTYSVTFTAATSTVTIFPRIYASGNMVIDNVSVRLAESDRSVKNNGLQTFGTVTKTAVATGAELVGYSFGNNANYLEQPYNSDLDFGTGDFSVMCWVKPDASMSAYPSIVDRYVSANNESTAWLLKIAEGTSSYYFYSNNTSIFTATGKVQFGVWQQVMAVRRSGVLYFYLNGRLEETGAMTHSITSSGAKLKVSKDATHHLGNSNLALLRVSATAPSEEQIAKMYNDEKHLFQTNAKATLYGTSDAVTALAYDDSTELLHVGTSAGRSEFQGLNRVNNTTDAVSAAISASNGFIVED